MAAKALSFRPSMTLPKWHTSMDMRMPPVASRRMYRHSATMHSHSTPMERGGYDKGIATRKEKKKNTVFMLRGWGWPRSSEWWSGCSDRNWRRERWGDGALRKNMDKQGRRERKGWRNGRRSSGERWTIDPVTHIINLHSQRKDTWSTRRWPASWAQVGVRGGAKYQRIWNPGNVSCGVITYITQGQGAFVWLINH